MLCESFADVLCGGRTENFCKALFVNVSESNLSAVVETASDNTPVVEYSYVGVEGAACSRNGFSSLVFALRARLLGSVIQISVLICATLASLVFLLSSFV